MSAESVQVVTFDIPNPEWGVGDQAHHINSNISYTNVISFDIRTLSTSGVDGANDITGLLYVPDLDSSDPCGNASAPYVPANVTRQASLPRSDYPRVGIAPWISANCSLSYMASARTDQIRALLFFLPGDSSTIPPSADDDVWNTPDADNWRSRNGFPVYALPSQSGQELMYQSSLYSGNMTEVPYGNTLSEIYPSNDYVRLFVDIDIGSASDLPLLWIFLLIVLGILLAIIGLTSLSMHWLQRRRREALRRRVASGEVDLEALGIKRLTVPLDILNQMPMYTYGTGVPANQMGQRDPPLEEKQARATEFFTPVTATDLPAPALPRTSRYHPTPLSQPTCAICLDDFVVASSATEGTTVRELPCHHIFHPECVDIFLCDSSSLCPMCKKTALPRGYCPRAITNAMVRRERMVRQLRERVVHEPEAEGRSSHEERDLFGNLRSFRTRTVSGFSQLRSPRRVSSAPVSTSQQMRQLQSETDSRTMSPVTAPLVQSTADPTDVQPRTQPPSTPWRRDWARRRAEAMLGQRAPADPEAEEAQGTSRWQKAMRGLFPRR